MRVDIPDSIQSDTLCLSQILNYMRTWELWLFRRFSPALALKAFLASFLASFRSRATLQMEVLALRHQIGILQRSAKERPKLTAADRILWAWLSGVWAGWRSALVIVKPETVIAWHRQGFRLFWTWKVRLCSANILSEH